MSVQNFKAIHQLVVETFQSGPNWWNDQPTDPDPCLDLALKLDSLHSLRISLNSISLASTWQLTRVSVPATLNYSWTTALTASCLPKGQRLSPSLPFMRLLLTQTLALSLQPSTVRRPLSNYTNCIQQTGQRAGLTGHYYQTLNR